MRACLLRIPVHVCVYSRFRLLLLVLPFYSFRPGGEGRRGAGARDGGAGAGRRERRDVSLVLGSSPQQPLTPIRECGGYGNVC